MTIIQKIKKNLVSMPGWSTNRKIVVIESDDWGGIRMPTRKVYDTLLADRIPVDKNYFTQYDTLESETDLSLLFSTLSAFKDKNGNHPCITANTVMANPVFELIEAANFNQYFFEPFTETYKKYKGCENSFAVWKQGINEHLLWPQFHGREHLNPSEWLKVLKTNDKSERRSFQLHALSGLGNNNASRRTSSYMAAFDFENKEEELELNDIVKDGLAMFEKIFGFKSTSFVASCGVRSDSLDEALYQNGVKYHQVGQQFEPIGNGQVKYKNRFWGAKNKFGQIYWRRNTTFEPARAFNADWVNSVLYEMDIAFRWGKPAVINSHRVNYIGGIDTANRDNTLRLLKELLTQITKRWPSVEFLSSDQLGNVIVGKQ